MYHYYRDPLYNPYYCRTLYRSRYDYVYCPPSRLELELSVAARDALLRSASPTRSVSFNYSASPARVESNISEAGRAILTKLFRHVATEESSIEMRR
jgi:hypothetical protein